MSADDSGVTVQREITRIALACIERSGFVLAGSGAIREHGVIDRPTEDIDLFTTNPSADEFDSAVDQVLIALRNNGYESEPTRRAPHYARLHVRTIDGLQVEVDMGVDWREAEPVRMEVGQVLSLSDAVGNKVSALYSRTEQLDAVKQRIGQWAEQLRGGPTAPTGALRR